MSSPIDDRVRSVLDRIRVSLAGQLETELSASTADILRVVAEHQRQIDEARDGRDSLEHELTRLRQHRDQVEQERRALEQQRDSFEQDRAALQRQLQHARHKEEENGRDADRARRQAEAVTREMESLNSRLATTRRLASAFTSLDRATTLGSVLEQLARLTCRDAGRTAVFLVNGDRLRCWKTVGFESGDSIVGADFEIGETGIVGEAARSVTGQRQAGSDGAGFPAFAATLAPRDASAIPVQVGGSVIAVLYADAGRADTPEGPEWLELIEAVARHAGRVLEAMTVRQAAARWTPVVSSFGMPRRRSVDVE